MPRTEADRTTTELLAANRVLLRAMRRALSLAKQLAEAELQLREAKKHVRALIAFTQPLPPSTVPLCADCQRPLDQTGLCQTCGRAAEASY